MSDQHPNRVHTMTRGKGGQHFDEDDYYDYDDEDDDAPYGGSTAQVCLMGME